MINLDKAAPIAFNLDNVPSKFPVTDVTSLPSISGEKVLLMDRGDVSATISSQCVQSSAGFDKAFGLPISVKNADSFQEKSTSGRVDPMLVYMSDGQLIRTDNLVTLRKIKATVQDSKFTFTAGPAISEDGVFLLHVVDPDDKDSKPIALFVYSAQDKKFTGYKLAC